MDQSPGQNRTASPVLPDAWAASSPSRRRRPGRSALAVAVALLLMAATGWALRFQVFESRHEAGPETAPARPVSNTTPTVPGDPAAGVAASLRHWRSPVVQRRAVRRLIDLGYPLSCGGTGRRMVALTFDDGPGPYTKATVEELRSAGAHATFFLVGKELHGWPHLTGLPGREAQLGAVGDHTWSHVDLRPLSRAQLADEIGRTQQAIAAAVGTPVTLFRPPYGAHDDTVDSYVRSQGMLEVLWSLDTLDSQRATPPEILANVERGLRPGAIVLMHENRGTTRRVLPSILRLVQLRRYRMVSIPELVAADPPSMRQLRTGDCS